MAVLGIEQAGLEFGIVLLDVPDLGFLQKVVAMVHQLTEAFQRLDDLGDIGDDGVVLAGDFGEKVVLDGRIDAELDFLGVDHDEFEFGRMFLVE